MNDLELSTEYILMLRSSMNRSSVRSFVFSRLEISLQSIGIDQNCIKEIFQLLMTLIKDEDISKNELVSNISNFERRWRAHLNRAYFQDYELIRWEFAKQFIFPKLPSSLGRCLDIGCGRGCITASIIQENIADEIVGIDEADFTNEWRERIAISPGGLRFHRVSVEDINKWALTNGKFDTILLFYVLHHSNDYWVSKTLNSISTALKKNGSLLVLEDSFVPGVPPLEDKDNIYQQWEEWTNKTPVYCLSVGYDIQVIMDFIAVKLLAGFGDVQMPCNYKTSNEWVIQFSNLGYKVSSVENIGFPNRRDIDVPQALFTLNRS